MQERDSWWLEIRDEIKMNARAMRCNAVIAYAECVALYEGLPPAPACCVCAGALTPRPACLAAQPCPLANRCQSPGTAATASERVHFP